MTLYFDEGGLLWHDLQRDEARRLMFGAQALGHQSASPDGRWLALAYSAADSSRLGLVDLQQGTVREVHAVPGTVVYTTAWSQEDAVVAFGYYYPRSGGGMGRGDILIATSDGTTRRVGCSASRTVATWMPSGDLIVGDSNNLYVVSAEGCRTLATNDVRKKPYVGFSADGQLMAYVFRDLVYQRATRQYVPDSTLFIADARGRSVRKLYGDERRARNISWSPTTRELILDLNADDNPSQRLILIFDAATSKASYLVAPEATGGASLTRPIWSSSGTNVAYTMTGDGYRQHAARTFGNTRVLGDAHGPIWGWAGDAAVVVPDDSGALQVVGLEDGEVIYNVPTGHTLVHAWLMPVL